MSTPNTPTHQPKPASLHIGARLLARNTAINLVGRIVPLLVGIVAMPYVIRHLGPDRFGLLSLAWMVVGYFALFNLGIGPATTKFVAELLGRGEREKLPELVWTALISQTCLGVVGGILLWASTPLLVDRLLKIPPDLHAQAHLIFLILAFALPIDFASGSMRGVLGASQRFDLLNIVGVPSSALTYLLPVVALWLGYGLPSIVLFLVIARIAAFFVVVSFCLRLYPDLRSDIHFNPRLVRKLLGFGGWVAASGAMGPLLLYTDRFVVGAVISLAAVGYYTVAYKPLGFLQFIPAALAAPLMPAFSSLHGSGESSAAGTIFLRAHKYVLLATTPVLFAAIIFAGNIFSVWVGGQFAAKATLPFQIMAVGMVVALLAPLSGALVQGGGRPEILCWLYLAELPVNTLLTWELATRWGLAGAALSFSIRSAVETGILFLVAVRAFRLRPRSVWPTPSARSVGFTALLVAMTLLAWALADRGLEVKSLASLAVTGAYAITTYRCALGPAERRTLWGILGIKGLAGQQLGG